MLRKAFTGCVYRFSHPLRVLSPIFFEVDLNSTDRAQTANCRTVRDFIRKKVRDRRNGDVSGNDFLGHLLQDEEFSKPDHEDWIVDELIDMLVAAT